MVQNVEKQSEELTQQILDFSKRLAGRSRIKAVCIYSDSISDLPRARSVIQVLLIVHDFQPKLMNYVKVLDERSIVAVAADEWVFERDVDRGLLGEALAWGLIRPYSALLNEAYLHAQEVALKKRLILELLENLVLDYPELSQGIYIKPEYFMYQAVLSRVRLFPPMTYGMSDFLREAGTSKSTRNVLSGYLEALKELEKDGVITLSEGYVRISEDFASNAQSPKTRLINLSKTVPRTLFTSALGVFPKILGIISQNRESLFKLQKIGKNVVAIDRIEFPESYVFVRAASGLIPLSSGLGVEATVRKVLSMSEDEKIEIQTIGGILNDVFLIKASTKCGERKLVVKRFRDWAGFKWFPLALWTVGTRSFAILGRSRLERECAINQLLHSKGFSVPRLLYVSSAERLVFMDYIRGETISDVIKRLADSKEDRKTKKDLKIIERVGRKLAKVHAIGVALGDTKPENIMIDKNGEIYLMDFEQAARTGDQVWDVAEFLYYAGHDVPFLIETHVVQTIAEAFIAGYLGIGGKAETIRKVANPKYTKVFSVFTLPHVILAISSICRKVEAHGALK